MKQHQLQHGYYNRLEANDDFISFVNFFILFIVSTARNVNMM